MVSSDQLVFSVICINSCVARDKTRLPPRREKIIPRGFEPLLPR
jgi:hypothetical protein